jgi:hypothetical protein
MTGARIAVAILAASVLAIAGCGGDDETSTVTETVAPGTESTAATTESSTATSSTTSSTTEDGTVAPADIMVKKLTGFSSPTGNIGCYIDRSSVRCDIQDRDWEPPKAPADCRLDYGQGIELRAGAAPEFVCAGDTTLGAGKPLEYGQSIGAGLLRCESQESGVTCTDAESGRSFTLSKESYDLG